MLVSGIYLKFSLLHWLIHWPGDAFSRSATALPPIFWRVCILLTRKLYKHVFDPCAGRQIAKVSAKEVFIITVSFEHHHNISSLTLLCGQPQDG
jgi:hypothetical protein